MSVTVKIYFYLKGIRTSTKNSTSASENNDLTNLKSFSKKSARTPSSVCSGFSL